MQTKKCCYCKKVKPVEEFHKDKSTKDGFHFRCILCDNANSAKYRKQYPERVRKTQSKFKGVYKHKQAVYDLKRDWKMTLEEKKKKIRKQRGKCAICKTKLNSLSDFKVDHDHETDQRRDLLCQCCNTGLGMFHEDQTVLLNAIMYLKRWASDDYKAPKEDKSRYGL